MPLEPQTPWPCSVYFGTSAHIYATPSRLQTESHARHYVPSPDMIRQSACVMVDGGPHSTRARADSDLRGFTAAPPVLGTALHSLGAGNPRHCPHHHQTGPVLISGLPWKVACHGHVLQVVRAHQPAHSGLMMKLHQAVTCRQYTAITADSQRPTSIFLRPSWRVALASGWACRPHLAEPPW